LLSSGFLVQLFTLWLLSAQKRRFSLVEGVERWVWSRYPWRRMKYSTLMLHERIHPEHPFAWTFIPAEKRLDAAGMLVKIGAVFGKNAVVKILQNFALIKSPSLRGAVARWRAEAVYSDYFQSQATKLCQLVEDTLTVAAPLCRDLADAGHWADPENWSARCQEKPFLVAPAAPEDEYRSRPESAWDVQDRTDLGAVIARAFERSSFRTKFRLRRGYCYHVSCDFLRGWATVTYSGPGCVVTTRQPIEWKRRAVPLEVTLRNAAPECGDVSSAFCRFPKLFCYPRLCSTAGGQCDCSCNSGARGVAETSLAPPEVP
jgi:hypothetical protein